MFSLILLNIFIENKTLFRG